MECKTTFGKIKIGTPQRKKSKCIVVQGTTQFDIDEPLLIYRMLGKGRKQSCAYCYCNLFDTHFTYNILCIVLSMHIKSTHELIIMFNTTIGRFKHCKDIYINLHMYLNTVERAKLTILL